VGAEDAESTSATADGETSDARQAGEMGETARADPGDPAKAGSAPLGEAAETSTPGDGRAAELGGAAVQPLADAGDGALGDGHQRTAAFGDDVSGLPPGDPPAQSSRETAHDEGAASELVHEPARVPPSGRLRGRPPAPVALAGANWRPGSHGASVRRSLVATKISTRIAGVPATAAGCAGC